MSLPIYYGPEDGFGIYGVWEDFERGKSYPIVDCLEVFVETLNEVARILKTAEEGGDPLTLKFGTSATDGCTEAPAHEGSTEPGQAREGHPKCFLQAIHGFGVYFEEVAPLVRRVADALNTDPHAREEWQLRLQHRRKGRPGNAMRQMFHESNIALAVMEAKMRLKKQEAAITDVCHRYGLSRSTVTKALASHKKRYFKRPGS